MLIALALASELGPKPPTRPKIHSITMENTDANPFCRDLGGYRMEVGGKGIKASNLKRSAPPTSRANEGAEYKG
jgi:hypothetical protein